MTKKVLIDECLPTRLAAWLTDCAAQSVGFMGWAGKDDGDVLRLAEAAGFDVLLTADANIKDQRNLAGMHLAIVVIPTNRQNVVESILPQIAQSIRRAGVGDVVMLSFDTPDFGDWPQQLECTETSGAKAILHKYSATKPRG